MNAVRMSFLQLLRSVKNDAMLFVVCFVPLICGLVFKFFIPFAEKLLTEHFSETLIITPYYALFDVILSMIAPAMFCFVAAMIILEEIDDHIARYLYITPLKQSGYFISRIGIPAFIAFFVTLILLPAFKLSKLSFIMILLLTASGTVQGIIIAMLVVSFSSNKLEGMAIAKLSFLIEFAALGPYFLSGSIQYLLTPFPSFWASKAISENNPLYFLLVFIISVFWFAVIGKKFLRKT